MSMKLPICNGTYSNEFDTSDIDFIRGVYLFIGEYLEKNRPYFSGLCNFCNEARSSLGQLLQQCGGCQLVGYCSRDCQKRDRPSHKYVCKEFPVVNGKNALYTTGLWETHISDLRQRAAQLPHADVGARTIFRNPRVCRTCKETRPDRLIDCKCACVSY